MNIRVLDCTRVLAGPWAAQQLADQGAEVIKVEPPSLDETRNFGPIVEGVSTYYLAANRNKRAITLDLKTDAGRRVARTLASTADVVLENFRPGVAERLGIDFETLRTVNPGLIYVAIHAFGDRGDAQWTARPGYDLALQAMGGGASITGIPDGPPLKCGLSIADTMTGMLTVQAVLFALLHRAQTGEGQKIVINMLQAQAAALSYHATRYFVTGEVEHRRGNAHKSLCPYDIYAARDGWFAVACGNDAIWQRLRSCLSIPDEPQWHTNPQRVEDRERVDTAVANAVSTFTSQQLDHLLREAGIPGGPVHSLDQTLRNPVVELIDVQHPVLDRVQMPGPFFQTATTRTSHTAPPEPGQHRDAVLNELGFDEEEIRQLHREGAFGAIST